jgi:CheY-like chemotaxis protein
MSKAPVLLVEDDPSDYRLIQRAFIKIDKSIPVIRLTNGDEAVAYLSGDPPYDNRMLYPMPSVVLLDLKLPRRSGFEVLTWVRQHPSTIRRIPIVVLTSSRHSIDVNRAYDLKANSYLVKPDTGSALEQMVSGFKEYWLGLNVDPDLQGRGTQTGDHHV